jgi:predicted SAM-dependent methyltransferase
MVDKTKIDLACGGNKKEGYYGIDISDYFEVDLVHDLTVYPWPIDDNSVEEVYCSHYIEHIPHVDIRGILKQSESFEEFKEKLLESKDGFISFVNELYRILKVGGIATVIVPYYTSVRALGDPTHTRYVGDFSFLYLNKEWRDNNKLDHYGITCDFDMVLSYHIDNDLTLKSQEIREEAFKKDWNAINDLSVKMTKR